MLKKDEVSFFTVDEEPTEKQAVTIDWDANAAEKAGFVRLAMSCDEKLTPGYFHTPEGKEKLKKWHEAFRANPCRIIDGNDAPGAESTIEWAAERGISIDGIRVGISGAMGDIVSEIADWEEVGTLLITGGDTLLSCMARMGVSELIPVAELYPGVVLSRFARNGKTRFSSRVSPSYTAT